MSGSPSSVRKGLILILGLPRSGTSWLGKVFDSHPDVSYLHEPDKHVQGELPVLLPVERSAEEREEIEIFLDKVLANRSPAVTGKRPFFPKSYRSGPRELLRRSLLLASRALPRPQALSLQIPGLIDPGRPDPRVVWKSINSVGRLGALARALPRSHVVLLVRHPCGQIASILRGHAAGKFTHALPSEQYRVLEALVKTDRGRAHGLTLAGLRDLQPVERMAWRWVLFMEKALEEAAGLAPTCRVLRYEDLCARPMEQTRDLFAFAGLDWHPQTEYFLHDSTKSDGTEYFGVRKDPQRSASKWQGELTEEDVQRILAIVRRSPAGRLVLDDEETCHQDAAG
jgi:hypothetical protein